MRITATRFGALVLCLGLAVPATAEQTATEDQAAQETTEPQTIVTIDGKPITNLHFALFVTQTGRQPEDAESQIDLLNEMINNFMVAESAEGQALAEEPEVKAALEVARARLLAQSFIRSEIAKVKIDEDEIKKIYDEQYGNKKRQEFKARHALLNSEEDAKALIKELDGGADFAELAKQRSIGPSKTVGGDLGWFAPDEMVAEFADATAALEDGAYSKAPVQTQFGWHVILREESRESPPPSLDTVRAEITQKIQQEQVTEAVSAIRKKANIEVQEAAQ